MTSILKTLETLLSDAGYIQRGTAIFEALDSHRLILLMEASVKTADWSSKVELALRNEAFRIAPTWSRYLVLVIDAERTTDLTAAAAAFCRDVSKCRRLIAFRGQTKNSVLPFLALPTVPRGAGTSSTAVEEIVFGQVDSPTLAVAFLDDQITAASVRELAEKPEIHS